MGWLWSAVAAGQGQNVTCGLAPNLREPSVLLLPSHGAPCLESHRSGGGGGGEGGAFAGGEGMGGKGSGGEGAGDSGDGGAAGAAGGDGSFKGPLLITAMAPMILRTRRPIVSMVSASDIGSWITRGAGDPGGLGGLLLLRPSEAGVPHVSGCV